MEQWSEPDRQVVHEGDGVIVFVESFFGEAIFVAETDGQVGKFYPDGSQVYIDKFDGSITTLVPGNVCIEESPGLPVNEFRVGDADHQI